jgi:hypothetical protein
VVRSGDLVAGGWNTPAITSKKMEWCAVAISDKVAARNTAPITGMMSETITSKGARLYAEAIKKTVEESTQLRSLGSGLAGGH